jgi:hypothetical protein
MTPLERLEAAADLYASVCEDRDHAMAYLKRAIRECDGVGVQRNRIARLARVSRQSVYDWIGEVQP